MKAVRVVKIMNDACMSTTRFASRLGYTRQGVVQWRSGRNRVPEPVALWLAKLEAWLASNPFPVRRVKELDDDDLF